MPRHMIRSLFFHLLPCCLALHVCTGCSTDQTTSGTRPTQAISGRAEDGVRFAVYRVALVPGWIRRDPMPDELLEDTTKALCDFFIRDNGATVRIAIHNFPTTTIEERIPPSAQVARWQQQLGFVDPAKTGLEPQAFNGYCGLLLSAENVDTAVLGWSLQLGTEHYRTLTEMERRDPAKRHQYRQMRADVTIKATGSPGLIAKHRDDIIAFARAFELIEEIPNHP